MNRPAAHCLFMGVACLLAALSAGPVAAAVTATSQATSYREAVVIGYNRSPRLALAPLKYADDDAIKLGSMLAQVYDRVTSLTEPDAETALLYPTFRAAKPTRTAVLTAITTAKHRLEAAVRGGANGELLFAFSGHGDVDREGRGLVYLADGALSQQDLATAIGDATRRYRVTLLVDACNAALLVGVRGSGSYGDRVPAGRHGGEAEQLANAALILSTSGRAEVHEWGLLLSGIFSYEVRSGLLGAADLDDDRRITFAELDAFVAAANARIANPLARLAPTIRGPAGDNSAIAFDLNAARAPTFLRVSSAVVGHAYLQDAALVRYADFNKGAERTFWLMLSAEQPYAMVWAGEEHALVVAEGSGIAPGKAAASATLNARGSLHDYYERNLFETAFNLQFAEQYWRQRRQPAEPAALSASETARLVFAPYLLPFAVGGGLAAFGALSYGGGWLAYLGAVNARWADETRAGNSISSGLAIAGAVTATLGTAVVVGAAIVLGVEVLSWRIE